MCCLCCPSTLCRSPHNLQVLSMSYEFYQGQMSGNLPAWNALLYSKGGWKKSAHLKDGSPIGVDLVGGFYDAGGMRRTTAHSKTVVIAQASRGKMYAASSAVQHSAAVH